MLNRRSFFQQTSALLAAGQANSFLRTALAASRVPVGITLSSMDKEFLKDPQRVIRAVARMGYQTVEFWGPYFDWTTQDAKDLRKLLDDLGLRCNSTHNDGPSFTATGLPKVIELNHIVGSKCLYVSGNRNEMIPAKGSGLDAWKRVADKLTSLSETLRRAGLSIGYHNHPVEFTPIGGKRPIDVITANTPKDVLLQLDVGTCVAVGEDPVAWIKANPGRNRSMHCKDWAPGPGKGYAVLFGEGVSPWSQIFAAAESVGGVEDYLLEQLTSSMPSLDAVERCLANWKKLRA
jgi:sugar phosphate isomerase/epimerase